MTRVVPCGRTVMIRLVEQAAIEKREEQFSLVDVKVAQAVFLLSLPIPPLFLCPSLLPPPSLLLLPPHRCALSHPSLVISSLH